MEYESEVKTYRIQKQCEKCKDGNMIWTGDGYRFAKRSYTHSCDKCNAVAFLYDPYPKTIYKEIGERKIISS